MADLRVWDNAGNMIPNKRAMFIPSTSAANLRDSNPEI